MKDELTQVAAITADLVNRRAWTLSDTDIVTTLTTLDAVTSQLACITATLVSELDARGIPADQGASSTAVWLREHLRVSNQTARRMIALAHTIDTRPALRAALADAMVNPEQVSVIAASLAALPNDIDAAIHDKAETVLLDQARQFPPDTLRGLGQRVLAHVAPDIADDVLRRRLDRDEAQAYRARTFTLTSDGTGRHRLSGWLDTEAAAVVTAAIDPLCKPNPSRDEVDLRSPGQRRADALTDVCRLALTTNQLPESGADTAHLTVTVSLDAATSEFGIGILDTAEPLSPTTIRRLACNARIIPALLGGDGAVLELGRSRRSFTGAVRRALVLRDGGCTFPGCDRPPRWCAAHHIQPWSHGGATNLDNGVLVCSHHHRTIHHSDWTIRLGSDRRPEFIPPVHIDPEQRPRRNTYHQRP